MTEVLMCSNVSRRYESAGASVNSLWDVSFRAGAGEMVAIVGPSGSGKTTLLCVAAGLERPDSGEVEITGRRLSSMNEIELDSLRSRCIGFAFQEPGLVPLLTALENVELGVELAAVERTDIRDRAKQALEIVGLSSRALHRAHELSGGEQHRVAIARALAKQPRLLLADEPTAQLDSESAAALVGLLSDVAKWGAAVVVSTHDASLVAGADRVLQLEDGRVVASSEQRGSRPRLLR